jgi:hypothetical protein
MKFRPRALCGFTQFSKPVSCCSISHCLSLCLSFPLPLPRMNDQTQLTSFSAQVPHPQPTTPVLQRSSLSALQGPAPFSTDPLSSGMLYGPCCCQLHFPWAILNCPSGCPLPDHCVAPLDSPGVGFLAVSPPTRNGQNLHLHSKSIAWGMVDVGSSVRYTRCVSLLAFRVVCCCWWWYMFVGDLAS